MKLAHAKLPARNAPARTASVARRRIERPSPDLFAWAGVSAPSAAPRFDLRKVIKLATGVWHASIDARHAVLCEKYFASSGLPLPESIDGDVLRFNPRLKNGESRSPGLVWLLRDVRTDEPTGILRYFLEDDGTLMGRRVLGRVYNAAIELDRDADVSTGLHIAADVESALAAMAQGYRPMWALPGARALSDFPVLGGVEALTVIGGDARAVAEVSARWRDAGREVLSRPP